MSILFGSKLFGWNIRCCSSSSQMASFWHWRRPRIKSSGMEVKIFSKEGVNLAGLGRPSAVLSKTVVQCALLLTGAQEATF